MFGLPAAAGLLSPANLLLANQLQAGVAQLQQPGAHNANDQQQQQQQQQLATFLQQQLWGMGLQAATNPMLPQALRLGLQPIAENNSNASATTQNNHNPASMLGKVHTASTQGMMNPAALFAVQNAAFANIISSTSGSNSISSAATTSNYGASSFSSNGGTSSSDISNHHAQQAAGVQAMLNNARGLALQAAQPQKEEDADLTGRPPVALYITCDDDSLSEYQCLVRKQIELFEA